MADQNPLTTAQLAAAIEQCAAVLTDVAANVRALVPGDVFPDLGDEALRAAVTYAEAVAVRSADPAERDAARADVRLYRRCLAARNGSA